MTRLDDPDLVRAEYADASPFSVRQAVWRWAIGPDAHDVLLRALAEVSPRCVLEVGPGRGELAQRMARELGADVVAVDQSERMVGFTRARGVEAIVGDAQALPFPDGVFDAAVAAWMLYHVPDVHRAIDELGRVLAPGGRLVAVTNGAENLIAMWLLVGSGPREYTFSRENGEEALRRRFSRVGRRDVDGELIVPCWEDARAYVAASPTRGHLAPALPRFEEPLVARRRVTVFVCDR